MTALAPQSTIQHSRQDLVETLLSEIDERRRQLYRLSAGGVRWAGMRDLKLEFRDVHQRLLDVVG